MIWLVRMYAPLKPSRPTRQGITNEKKRLAILARRPRITQIRPRPEEIAMKPGLQNPGARNVDRGVLQATSVSLARKGN